jgi:hypothetical protein
MSLEWIVHCLRHAAKDATSPSQPHIMAKLKEYEKKAHATPK